jgi:N6-adenosine-specific RNA methylase IME4/ParB-like chromosome segregation protein Spo0J
MPALTQEEYAELKADIAARGVMVPVEYDERGSVIDGHHRIRICAELGIRDFPKVIRAGMSEQEKLTRARKLNRARRHITPEQRRNLIREQLRETPEKSDRQIAAGLGVSDKTVSAQRERMEATGGLLKFNSSIGAGGKGRPRQAQRKPVSVFNPASRAELALQNPGIVEKIASGKAKSVIDAQRKALKDTILAGYENRTNTTAQADIFTTAKKYRIVYADPPWPYSGSRSGQGITGAAGYYPTLPLRDICALPAANIPEKHAALFLRVASPFLEACFVVARAWGFTCKAHFVWDKVRHNMGHYNSVRHELLLICTRGSCVPDAPKLYDSVQTVERGDGQHSRKPEEFRGIIDTLYGAGNRIELFARRGSAGWDTWGYEAV